MAFLTGLTAVVGQPTRGSLINNIINNVDWMQGLLDAQHNFGTGDGDGTHTAITATSITTTGAAVIGGKTTVAGTYALPLVLGTIRIWHDSTTGCIRAKYGSDPSSITDGNIILEGTT